MPVSLIPSFLVYCYTGAITPGPANLCSLSAALRYGRGPALKQWQGLLAGFSLLSMAAVVITYFLGSLLNQYVGCLSWVGAAYLLRMAWHTLHSAGETVTTESPVFPSFRTGLIIQASNVKVMVFCLTALSGYVLPYSQSFPSLLAAGLFLILTGPPCNLIWLFAGASLQKLFAQHRKVVDVSMAAALVLCALSLVWPH